MEESETMSVNRFQRIIREDTVDAILFTSENGEEVAEFCNGVFHPDINAVDVPTEEESGVTDLLRITEGWYVYRPVVNEWAIEAATTRLCKTAFKENFEQAFERIDIEVDEGSVEDNAENTTIPVEEELEEKTEEDVD